MSLATPLATRGFANSSRQIVATGSAAPPTKTSWGFSRSPWPEWPRPLWSAQPRQPSRSRHHGASVREGALHLSAVGRAGATPFPGRREPLPGVLRRRARLTPRRRSVPGLPGLAEMAGRLLCPHCDEVVGWRLADGRWSCARCARRVSPRRQRRSPWPEESAHGLLRRGLAHDERHAGRLRPRPATCARDRVLPDCLGDAASLPQRDGASRARPALGHGGGRRDLPRRARAWRPRCGALGKILFEVAVEQLGRGFGRCRMQVIDDASVGRCGRSSSRTSNRAR